MSRKSETDSARRWVAIVGVVLALFVVFNIVSYVWFPFLPYTEQRDAGQQVVEQEISAEQAVENYRWFRQKWASIQSDRRQLEAMRDRRERFLETYGNDTDDWSRTTKEEYNQIETTITAIEKDLERKIAEYNARSADVTRSMFKCHLPYMVDERFQVTGPPGSGSPETPNDKYLDGADPSKEPPKAENCDGLPDEVRTGS